MPLSSGSLFTPLTPPLVAHDSAMKVEGGPESQQNSKHSRQGRDQTLLSEEDLESGD